MKQGSVLRLWMDENASQQSNKKSLMKEKLQYHRESTTKLARTVPTQGVEQGHSTGEVCWKYFCILLWFIFMSPKWTRTKIVFVISK